jgi:hypothetical protein
MTPCKYQELASTLNDLYEGRRVIVPHDIDHAHQMLHVAMCYINQDQQDVLDALSKDYA